MNYQNSNFGNKGSAQRAGNFGSGRPRAEVFLCVEPPERSDDRGLITDNVSSRGERGKVEAFNTKGNIGIGAADIAEPVEAISGGKKTL